MAKSQKNRRRNRRRLHDEVLEPRCLLAGDGPPQIVAIQPDLATRIVTLQDLSIEVRFDERIIGGDDSDNFEIVGAGDDQMLDTTDDRVVSGLQAFYSDQTTLLKSTSGKLPGKFRLTVFDSIVDADGNALDGNANLEAGGNWTTEFYHSETSLSPENTFFGDPAGPQPDSAFGEAIATSNKFRVVGAKQVSHNGILNAGAAFVFDMQTGQLLHRLRHPDPFINSRFGFSVGIAGDTIIVGSESSQGNLHSFNAITGDLEQTFLHPHSSNGSIGSQLATLGRTLIAADETDATQGGSLLLFNLDTGEHLQTIANPAPSSNDNFGSSVVATDDYIIVGIPGDAGTSNVGQSGSVAIFDATTKLLLSTIENPVPRSNANFGASLAVVGDQLVVGAPKDAETGVSVGRVYQFDLSTNSLVRTLSHPTPASNQRFGEAVAMDSDSVYVGVPGDSTFSPGNGSVFAFGLSTGSSQYVIASPIAGDFVGFGSEINIYESALAVGSNSGTSEIQLFSGVDGSLAESVIDPSLGINDQFARQVAASDDYVVVASFGSQDDSPQNSWLWVYDTETMALVNTIANPSDFRLSTFGESISIAGDLIVVGDPRHPLTTQFDVGMAYVIHATTGEIVSAINSPLPANQDRFGNKLSANGNRVAIVGRSSSGTARSVYLFDLNTGGLLRSIELPSAAQGVAMHGDYVIVLHEQLEAYDANTGDLIYSLTPGPIEPFKSTVVTDGVQVVVNSYSAAFNADAFAHVYNLTDGTLVSTLETVSSGTIDIDAGRVISGRIIMDAASGRNIAVVGTPPGPGNNSSDSAAIVGDRLWIGYSDSDLQNSNQGALVEFNLSAPFDLTLSNTNVDENQPAGTEIATILVADLDEFDSHTFELVSGEGDDDNGKFQITGNTLSTSEQLDFETGSTLSFRVQVMDESGGTLEKSFVVQVNDLDEISPTLSLNFYIRNFFEQPILAGLRAITFRHDEPLVGREVEGSVTLLTAGGDERLGTGDDLFIPIGLSDSDTSTRVSFDGLQAGTYRLRFSSSITDVAGNALDGNDDGVGGDDWFRDFQVRGGVLEVDLPDHLRDFKVTAGLDLAIVGDQVAVTSYKGFGSIDDITYVDLFDRETGAHLASLTNPSSHPESSFGATLASDGNRLLISDANNYGPDNVSVFDSTTGTIVSSLANPSIDPDSVFGLSLAISGNMAAVGSGSSPINGNRRYDEIHLFDLQTSSYLRTISQPDSDLSFFSGDNSIDLQGDRLIVSTQSDGEIFDADSAQIFDVNTGNLIATLVGPDDSGDILFGSQVIIDNGIAFVTAPETDVPNPVFPIDIVEDAGAVMLFDTTDGSFMRTIVSPSVISNSSFGASISISNGMLAVGQAGESTFSKLFNQIYFFDPAASDLLGSLKQPGLTPSVTAFVNDFDLKDGVLATITTGDGRIADLYFADVALRQITATNDQFAVEQDGMLQMPSSGVLVNDSASLIGPISLDTTPVVEPNNGIVELSPSGAFTYTPNPGFIGIDSFVYRASTSQSSADATVIIEVVPPLGVETILINGVVVDPNLGGPAQSQRFSLVDELVIRLNGPATFAGDAFSLIATGGQTLEVIPIDWAVLPNADAALIRLSFSDISSSWIEESGRLGNGAFQLTINSGAIIDQFGNQMQIDDNGQPGQASNLIDEFFTKFGDITGDGIVGLNDFAAFRSAFGLDSDDENFIDGFDLDRNQEIGLLDFAGFRSGFGT